MRVGWLLLVVAAALAVGSAVAVEEAQFFFFVLPAIFMLALAMAALLLLPLIVVRGLTGRAPKPPWPLIAAALTAATLVVFPVKATVAGDLRDCPESTIPLPEHLLDGRDATVVYLSTCEVGGVAD